MNSSKERLRRLRTLGTPTSTTQWYQLASDLRWAVGQLARSSARKDRRHELNQMVMRATWRLYPRKQSSEQIASTRLLGPFVMAWITFLGAAMVAGAATLTDATTVYAIVPRALLGQIADHAWGVRGGASADLSMTIFYSVNNSRACLLALGLGILGGLPGFAVLAYNGALFGAIAGHAYHLGLLTALLGWLGPHAVPELTALMLSAAIGWALATAWMVPGPRTRGDALAQAGTRAMPLIGVTLLLVMAAAPLEGFVSPLKLPWWMDFTIAAAWVVGLVAAARRGVHLETKSA